jgi:APA family basic amino acid/polyamine antiporter
VLFCITMIISLDKYTQIVAFIWMLLGLVVYFAYGKNHSNLRGTK